MLHVGFGNVKTLAIRNKLISKLYQLSGYAVTPAAYRILCVRFVRLVHQSPDSATDATLDTGGWLALTRPGLSPGKMRQAYLGAITSKLSCGSLAGRPLERRVGQRCHSITWSARSSNDRGIDKPSALAVLRLITNSNLVGCSTGSSAGLAPLSILSTYVAARRNIAG